ncbi:MAG: chlorite dismutase family protein [Candidatus Binatia bacterium]|nr:chlorite dismutase family protein [Candidatus Binatia bacterium]
MADEKGTTGPTDSSGAGEAGWPVLHMFQRLDRECWLALASGERTSAIEEYEALLTRCNAEEGLQFIASGVIGKADLGLIIIHPSLGRVQRLTQELAATRLGACLETIYSFLSISEKSEYISSTGDHARKLIDDEGLEPTSPEFQQKVTAMADRMSHYAEMRMHPQLPSADEYPVLCFYPMSKKREDGGNWYSLSFEERKRLMGSHATAGRRYAGRVTQLITSSTGLDDWEWGVTLFTRDLKAIRDIVYEMRYDEGSALYGLFGPFYVGIRIAPGALGDTLQL